MSRASVITLVVAIGGLVGCSDEPTASGLEDARVALVSSAVYGMDDTELHGRVILVDGDGSIRTLETEGLYFGSASSDGSRLFASDAQNEIVLDNASTRVIPRRHEYDMQDWSGQLGQWHWTLFNVGTRGTKVYHTGVSATDGSDLAEGEIEGELMGATVCDGRLLVAMGTWARPHDPRGTRLLELRAVDGRLETSRLARLDLPGGARVANLGCVDAKAVVLALRENDNQLWLAREANLGAPTFWIKVPGAGRDIEGYEQMLGHVGDELFFYSAGQGVSALNVISLDVRLVLAFDGSRANTVVGLQGSTLMAWVTGGSDPSVIQWHDAQTGALQHEISGAEVDRLLARNDEMVDHAPIWLGQSTTLS